MVLTILRCSFNCSAQSVGHKKCLHVGDFHKERMRGKGQREEMNERGQSGEAFTSV